MKNPTVEEMIQKTSREMEQSEKPQSRSRMWQSPNDYIHLVAWSNACLLRIFVRRFTDTLPKKEFRLKTQLDDAGRSTVANIEEGFARPTTKEYIDYLGFSYASLKEVKGDIQRCRQDGYLRSVPGSSLAGLGINLKDWHEKLKESVISKPAEAKGVYRNLEESKGSYRKLEERGISFISSPKFLQSPLNSSKNPQKSFTFDYAPVDNLQASNFTYEIFIELINKTDWNLRKLVESLENKKAQEKKFYQVEQARIRMRIRGR